VNKILIIDDDKNFASFVKKGLEVRGGFEVLICSDCRNGAELAKKVRPGLILLDVMMPGMDGPDVAAQLRDDPETEQIPLIFLTSAVTEEEVRGKNAIGGWQYLPKPVDINKLLETVNKFLR
jgi:DNA-binding response OmpR family regulator